MDMKWRQIKTAPKDGTYILSFDYERCYSPEIVAYRKFSYSKPGVETWRTDIGFIRTPTHWMPLPKPPTE